MIELRSDPLEVRKKNFIIRSGRRTGFLAGLFYGADFTAKGYKEILSITSGAKETLKF